MPQSGLWMFKIDWDITLFKSIIMLRGTDCILWNTLGCNHSKVDQTSAPVYESRGCLSQTPISSSKMLFKIDYFSWWPLLLSQVLKYRISIWDLQNLSWKVMRKNNWLNIILNVSFMTLNILNLIIFHVPWIHYKLEVIVIFFFKIHQFCVL